MIFSVDSSFGKQAMFGIVNNLETLILSFFCFMPILAYDKFLEFKLQKKWVYFYISVQFNFYRFLIRISLVWKFQIVIFAWVVFFEYFLGNLETCFSGFFNIENSFRKTFLAIAKRLPLLFANTFKSTKERQLLLLQ